MKKFIKKNWYGFVLVLALVALIIGFVISFDNTFSQPEDEREKVTVTLTGIEIVPTDKVKNGKYLDTIYTLTAEVTDKTGNTGTWTQEINERLQTLNSYTWLREGENYIAERNKETGEIFQLSMLKEQEP